MHHDKIRRQTFFSSLHQIKAFSAKDYRFLPIRFHPLFPSAELTDPTGLEDTKGVKYASRLERGLCYCTA